MHKKEFAYIAIIAALLVHLVVLVVMNFVTLGEHHPEVVFVPVEMAEIEEVLEEKTLEELITERIQQDVANLVADANADQSMDRRNLVSRNQQERIDRQVDEELDELASNTFAEAERRRQEQLLDDEQERREDQIDTDHLDKFEYYNQSYNGNVTGEVNVPGREVRYLHIPGYKCKGGGMVVINVVVDRNGGVIEADLDLQHSEFSGEECIPQEALASALKSKFYVKSSAPKRSTGTITYRFVPQ